MIEIYLVRHGLTESNKRKIYMGTSDEGLSPEGVNQVNALGEKLKSLETNRIYSSPLRRSLETSEVINQFLNVPIEIEKNLTEMKLGPWQGLSEEGVSRKFPDDYQLWNTKPGDLVLPNRETLSEVQQRAVKAINNIGNKEDKCPVLAVTHVAIIRCMIIHFQKLDINHYRTIDVPNVSVFSLQLDDKSACIRRFL